MSEADRQTTADEALDLQAHLLRAERQIAWLRWIGIAGWLYILLSLDEKLGLSGWAVYVAGLVYTLAAQLMIRFAAPISASARITTTGDPLLTTAMCLATGGITSVFFPFYYFTLLAAAFRYGRREAIVVFIFNVALACVLYFFVPGAGLRTLAVSIFYLVFSALLGIMLVTWAEENLAVAQPRTQNRARQGPNALKASHQFARRRAQTDIGRHSRPHERASLCAPAKPRPYPQRRSYI